MRTGIALKNSTTTPAANGGATAKAVSRPTLTAKAWIQSQGMDFWRKNCKRIGFPPRTTALHCHLHSTNASQSF